MLIWAVAAFFLVSFFLWFSIRRWIHMSHIILSCGTSIFWSSSLLSFAPTPVDIIHEHFIELDLVVSFRQIQSWCSPVWDSPTAAQTSAHLELLSRNFQSSSLYQLSNRPLYSCPCTAVHQLIIVYLWCVLRSLSQRDCFHVSLNM